MATARPAPSAAGSPPMPSSMMMRPTRVPIMPNAGAAPANFLDIGGGADEEKVSEALKIVYSDPAVSRVLINVFGGILRCDVAARGFIKASEEMGDSVRPMVVRMLGTNAEEGRKLLTESKLDVTMVNDLNEAAEAIKSSH